MALGFIVLALCIVGSLTVPTPLQIDETLNGRVFGGSPAPLGSYPYIVSLYKDGRHSCAGSIVSKNYVITAAHCVDRATEDSVTIKAGTNKLSDEGHLYSVIKIHYHEDFDRFTVFNDVAILEVEEIDLTLPFVSKIRADTEFVHAREPVTLAGWGSTWLGGPMEDDLQHVLLAAISVRDCQIAHCALCVRDTQVCTFTRVGQGACFGDSGGPLVRKVDDQERLVGIVSWGFPCASGKPDVFGRVSSYVSWFNDKCNNCLNQQ